MGSNNGNGKGLQIEYVSPFDLNPFIGNPRRIEPDKLEWLRRSLSEFGFVDPIIARREDGMVIGGHQRLEAAKQDELKTVPVIYLDGFDDAKMAMLNIALNQPVGEWDNAKLADLLQEYDTGEIDLTVCGFSESEMTELMHGLDEHEPDPRADEIPEATEAICKLGDLWQLGEHRLLCGDATKEEDVARLMDGVKADMVFTDPPYGVAVNAGSPEDLKKRHRRSDGKLVENDNLQPEALRDFLTKAFARIHSIVKDGGALYICHAESLGMDVMFRQSFSDAGFKPAEIIVWVKDVFAFGRQDYHWRHEPIIYGWKPGAAHYFVADRTQDTVWEIDRPKRSDDHPTMKPVALCEKGIRNSSRHSETVYDPFGGSGSTLIACEQTKRKCRMMEIEPHYCDVIIKRWEEFTGGSARRI